MENTDYAAAVHGEGGDRQSSPGHDDPGQTMPPAGQGRKVPLPGLVRIYLFGLYLGLAVVGILLLETVLVGMKGGFYKATFFAGLILGLTGLVTWINVAKITGRSPTAPGYTRVLLMLAILLVAAMGAYLIWAEWGGQYRGFSRYVETSNLFVPLFLGLVLSLAWYRYWRVSPRIRETFLESSSRPVDATPAGVQATRLGGALITGAGAGGLVSLFLAADFSGTGELAQFPWLNTVFFAGWVLIGLLLFRAYTSSESGPGRLFRTAAWALLVLLAFELVNQGAQLATGLKLGVMLYGLAPRMFVYLVVCACLAYADRQLAGGKAAGAGAMLDRAFASGVTWVELCALPGLAYFFLNSALLEGAVSLILSLAGASDPPDVLVFTGSPTISLAAAVAGALVLAGSLVLLRSRPEKFRVFVVRGLAGVCLFLLAEIAVTACIGDNPAWRFYRAYHWLWPIALTLGLVALYSLRREGLLAGRPAPIVFLRGVCWYFVIQGAVSVALAVLIPFLVSDLSGFARDMTGPFPLVFLATNCVWLQGLAGAALLRVTQSPRSGSFTSLLAWGCVLAILCACADLLGLLLGSLFMDHAGMALQRLNILEVGNPWMNPSFTLLGIVVLVCATWDQVAQWYQGSRCPVKRQ